jgi:hypothetical protein
MHNLALIGLILVSGVGSVVAAMSVVSILQLYDWIYERLSPPEDLYDKGDIMAVQPTYTELDRMGNSCDSRYGARITNFLLHTEEGNSTAEGLAAFCNNTGNGASYHYTVRNGIVCDVVDTDYASWSVGDANSYTINLCFAGSRAAWSRDQWLAISGDLQIAAWLAVQDCKKYGISTAVIAPPYHRADGISDHRYVTDIIGWGTHTDVGDNFPWDVFTGYVNGYVNPGPVPNAINDKAAQAPWLGTRITAGEGVCPDKVGRYAQFQNGYVYWSPATGAHTVPNSLFGKWATLKWEAGLLGYPILDNAAVTGGECQAFQNGCLYHEDGKPVVAVHGAILNSWAKAGYEKSPLGWPITDETPFGDGVVQQFDHGKIYWSPSGIVTIKDQ